MHVLQVLMVVATLFSNSKFPVNPRLPDAITGTQHDQSSLEGLNSIGIYVNKSTQAQAENTGYSSAALQIATELQLRQSGIDVLPPPPIANLNTPTLYVKVNLFPANELETYWAYYVEVSFKQSVQLKRRPTTTILLATTWTNEPAMGFEPSLVVSETIRKAVHDAIDAFCKDYDLAKPLKVN